jgi:hypothetical protein
LNFNPIRKFFVFILKDGAVDSQEFGNDKLSSGIGWKVGKAGP